MTTKTSTPASTQHVALGYPISIPSHSLPSLSSSSQTNVNAAASGSTNQGGTASTLSSASLVNPNTLALSLPHSNQSVPIIQVDAQALHYLTLEMPKTLRNSTKSSIRKRRKVIRKLSEAGFSVEGLSSDLTEAEEVEDELVKRLETIGSHVGANFAERLSRDRAGFPITLDILKFICKEVWTAIWDKQVDNLRTNHRGVYVLQDNVFKPLLRVSLPPTPSAAKELVAITKIQLAFPVGIIRGALARLGVPSTVVAETAQIPQCTFHVKTAAHRA